MNHKQKKHLARKLITKEEKSFGVGLFLSKAWDTRKTAIKQRVARNIAKVAERRNADFAYKT